MTDSDLINAIASEPIRPPEHVSFEEIIANVPCMSKDNPALYSLYLHYNENHLDDSEIFKIESIIRKFQIERTNINKKNIEYMERDKKKSE